MNNNLLSYTEDKARQEYRELVVSGIHKAEAARQISLKKWTAISEGNTVYYYHKRCGFCFMAENHYSVICDKCVWMEYLRLFQPRRRWLSCCTGAKRMIKIFTSNKFREFIDEKGKE